MLYGAGHPPERVDGYTLDMVRAFSRAIDRDRKRRERALAILIRATQYEPKAFADFLKE